MIVKLFSWTLSVNKQTILNNQSQTVSIKDEQNALRRECTIKIEIVLEIGVAGVNI